MNRVEILKLDSDESGWELALTGDFTDTFIDYLAATDDKCTIRLLVGEDDLEQLVRDYDRIRHG